MSVIGQQIKKYRTLRGITQEQLGNTIGVTTQAVSKWERGGTPDAELMPALADALGVSTDALYGREQQSLARSIARQVCCLPEKEAFKLVFRICWAMEFGLQHNLPMLEDFFSSYIELDEVTLDKADYAIKIVMDSGISTTRLSPDLHHFFLMEEPEGGIKDQLSDMDELWRVFKIFADRKLLKIMAYMLSRENTPIATSLISKNTGMDNDEVDRCMELLCKNRLADCSLTATENGTIKAYTYRHESSIIPMLCFADEIARDGLKDFLWVFNRKKPLL